MPLGADVAARVLPGTDATPSGPSRATTLSLGEGVHVLGLRWTGPEPAAAELRLRTPDGAWGEWAPLDDATPVERSSGDPLAHASTDVTDASGEPVTDDLAVTRATTGDVVVGPAEVEVRLVGEASDASVEVWTTQATADDAAAVAALPVTSNELVIGTRADWGADESAPRVSRPIDLVHDFPKMGVTVHHTAGVNDYASTDVPSIIRGIFYYHGQTLQWDDIGYAALVDKYGRVWEGRAGGVEENIQLAHAFGMNRDWTGVSVLGNHETAIVWATELTALSELTAWELATHGVTPGTTVDYENPYFGWTRTLDVVHGHRDVDDTLCPGWQLYALMDTLRARVAADHAEDPVAVQRHGGADRYAVAAGIARRAYLEGARTAYLASGNHIADALGVGPIAAQTGAAVMLTRTATVPIDTMASLDALGVREVVLVGGEEAIAPSVVGQLTTAGYTVQRVHGSDRYETAAMLATQNGRPGGTVYLAAGTELADALSAAAAAAEQDAVVVLTQPGRLPSVTATALTTLQPSRVVVLGGELSVSEPVRAQVASLLPGAQVDRVGGGDRFETSALVAMDAFDSASAAVVANAYGSADAVVATQLAARHGSPVLLVKKDCRPGSVNAAYTALGITLSRLAGGTGVLSWSAGYRVC
ncbi:hypothetical protein GCM10009584_11170 [Ornithinimicrobium humiphilum]|uniref:N-acetylmuramoyl-L-alanine amidase n=1 Tax=Ornithinimicrobium humiphilum TaxID=125288 RepID=A0A543KJF8_9MICO|nr:N-acetylmuramoyl-L-alanine amidase [Ornithinimicrobium humiphilum]